MEETETKATYGTAPPPSQVAGEGREVDKPQDIAEEGDAPEGGDDAPDEEQTLDKPLENKGKPAPPLTISVVLYGMADEHGRHRSAFLGVREGEVDPIFETVLNPTLEEALASVAPLLEVARLRWATNPKYPAYQRPTPPPSATPARPRPAAPAAPAKPPLPKSAPKGQTSIFG